MFLCEGDSGKVNVKLLDFGVVMALPAPAAPLPLPSPSSSPSPSPLPPLLQDPRARLFAIVTVGSAMVASLLIALAFRLLGRP